MTITEILHRFLAENYRLSNDIPEDTHIIRTVNEDAISEARQAIEDMFKQERLDELKKAWNATQPVIVPEGWEADDYGKYLQGRIKELEEEPSDDKDL